MSFGEPNESQTKISSAWILIVVSIILFFMTMFKLVPMNIPTFVPSSLTRLIRSVMGENSMYHGILYLILFVLVFSSAILGFFYKEDK